MSTAEAAEKPTADAQMKRWICVICGFIYDDAVGMPEHGIAAGTRFEDLPDDWICPECGSPKSAFEIYEE
ncbi:rubredoxin [Hydrocarboniphaga effusa]|uniref:rubredoxin n=1 Tax=Hydrocarboniphaga effusa TaxID=243629 RepID=UPI0035AF1032